MKFILIAFIVFVFNSHGIAKKYHSCGVALFHCSWITTPFATKINTGRFKKHAQYANMPCGTVFFSSNLSFLPNNFFRHLQSVQCSQCVSNMFQMCPVSQMLQMIDFPRKRTMIFSRVRMLLKPPCTGGVSRNVYSWWLLFSLFFIVILNGWVDYDAGFMGFPHLFPALITIHSIHIEIDCKQ